MEITMKYVIDHDYHIHSKISQCSSNPEQIPENILAYAREKGLKRVILTDHFWDENVPGASYWYKTYHKFTDLSKALPLPQDDEIEFLFGCETEMDKNGVIAVSPERFDEFDFIIVPTTHLHMKGLTLDEADYCNVPKLAKMWVDRFDALLNADLPFHKVGIAHLTCSCIAVENRLHIDVLKLISDDDMRRLFKKVAQLGLGIEINAADFNHLNEYGEIILRPYRIAKECGCKFYLGTDSHKPSEFGVFGNFAKVIDLLELTENDKFQLSRG